MPGWYLIGDHPAQASRAAALMERLEAGTEKAEILESVIAETVWTLRALALAAVRPRPRLSRGRTRAERKGRSYRCQRARLGGGIRERG
jgi:hypothetical protein